MYYQNDKLYKTGYLNLQQLNIDTNEVRNTAKNASGKYILPPESTYFHSCYTDPSPSSVRIDLKLIVQSNLSVYIGLHGGECETAVFCVAVADVQSTP